MTPTAIKDLSSQEICSIIQTSKEAGVTVLKYKGLELSFGPKAVKAESLPQAPIPVKEITDEQHEKNNKIALELEELNTKEDLLEHLMIVNPRLYEQMIVDGDLKDDSATKSATED